MNTKIWLSTFVLSLIAFVNIFDLLSSSDGNEKKRVDSSFDLKEKQFDSWFKTFDANASRNRVWGLPSAVKIKKKPTPTAIKKLTPVSKKAGENKICIDKSCYRLLAIKNIDKNFEALFYNRDFKEKVQLFEANSSLEKGIFVKKITVSHVFLEDNSSDRRWEFKMFDVNTTQYKPKGRND